MSITLASLKTRLQAAVPTRNSVPSSDGYDQLVKDAVDQLSHDLPILKTTSLNIVANTASYNLPSDFLSLIELSTPPKVGDVYITAAGLVPIPPPFAFDNYEPERVTVEGDQLVIYPTPTYAAARTLRYAAGYVLVDGSYAKLTENGARVALLYAQYLALNQQANAVAGDGWSYQIGDERVDKTRQGEGLRNQAEGALKQYQSVVHSQQGYGARARHNMVGEPY